jgi:glycine/D-amino acid oxidase-like deaminating enzyme
MGYCRGLARAALGAGAEIAVGVRVLGLDREGDAWRVRTSRGELRAQNVVLGTNAYTDTLWPALKDVFTIIHYVQLATAPLGPDASHILPGRQGLWDNARFMKSFRRDAHDRLVIGTMGRVIGNKDSGITRRWAEKVLSRLFPELGPVTFDEAWHGQIAMTPSHLPQVHMLAPGLWTAIGYNGRGITTGTVFGQAMAGLLTGARPEDLPLPLTDPRSVRGAPVTNRFYDMAFAANQFWRSLR